MGVRSAHVSCSRLFLGNSTPYKERQLWHLYNGYGASTGVLARDARDPTRYEGEAIEQAESMTPAVLKLALASPYSDDDNDLFVVIEPLETSCADYVKTIASKRVLQVFMERYFW